jgi:hypothetical protein
MSEMIQFFITTGVKTLNPTTPVLKDPRLYSLVLEEELLKEGEALHSEKGKGLES